jgi:membrane protein DedA with SNARE-associated domain
VSATDFIVRHGYAVLFAVSLLGQFGLPLPSAPLLLTAGALAAVGKMNAGAAVLLSVLASMLGHVVWFEAGRRRGGAVLRLVCRISLEPDTCVRKTENLFLRYGPKSIIASPFLPGLSAVVPPLAGMSRMSLPRFLLLDAAGALLYAGCFTGLGYGFSAELERILDTGRQLAGSIAGVVAILIAGYVAWKVIERQRIFRALRIARITPEELKRMVDAGAAVAIIDLRHELDLAGDRRTLPGALRIGMDELEKRSAEIPRDREIALYCT